MTKNGKITNIFRAEKGPKPKSAKLMGQRMAPKKEKSRLEPHIGQHPGDFGRKPLRVSLNDSQNRGFQD